MNLERAVSLERELGDRIKSTYRETVHFGRTHQEHLERMRQYVWHTPAYKNAPRWLHTYLQGIERVCFDFLYETPLDYRVNGSARQSPLMSIIMGNDGRMFDNDEWLKESSEYKSAMQTVHVWRRYWEEGKFKPF